MLLGMQREYIPKFIHSFVTDTLDNMRYFKVQDQVQKV